MSILKSWSGVVMAHLANREPLVIVEHEQEFCQIIDELKNELFALSIPFRVDGKTKKVFVGMQTVLFTQQRILCDCPQVQVKDYA